MRLTVSWHPAAARKLTSVLPFFVEVNNHPGGTAAFDLPPGRSRHSEDFALAVGGTLFGAGAHVHDYATAVWIEDLATKRTIVRLDAKLFGDGRVRSVARYIPGPEDEPLRLKANHRYRIITEYENPTRDTIPNGGMSSIAGPFIPGDMAKMAAREPRRARGASGYCQLGDGGRGRWRGLARDGAHGHVTHGHVAPAAGSGPPRHDRESQRAGGTPTTRPALAVAAARQQLAHYVAVVLRTAARRVRSGARRLHLGTSRFGRTRLRPLVKRALRDTG